MATTSRVQDAHPPGDLLETVTDVTLDSSYAEGGEPVTAGELGLRYVSHAHCSVIHGSEAATVRPTDPWYSGGKVHLTDLATGKEVASGKDLSKVVVRVYAYGK